jgi:hypothetical protein
LLIWFYDWLSFDEEEEEEEEENNQGIHYFFESTWAPVNSHAQCHTVIIVVRHSSVCLLLVDKNKNKNFGGRHQKHFRLSSFFILHYFLTLFIFWEKKQTTAITTNHQVDLVIKEKNYFSLDWSCFDKTIRRRRH